MAGSRYAACGSHPIAACPFCAPELGPVNPAQSGPYPISYPGCTPGGGARTRTGWRTWAPPPSAAPPSPSTAPRPRPVLPHSSLPLLHFLMPGPPVASWKLWLKICYEPGSESLQVTIFRAKATQSGIPSSLCGGMRVENGAGQSGCRRRTRRRCTWRRCCCPGRSSCRRPPTPTPAAPPSTRRLLSKWALLFVSAFRLLVQILLLLFQVSPQTVSEGQVRLSLYELNAERTRICLGCP